MKTATVRIGGKDYTLTPMTISETKKARNIAVEFNALRSKGSVTQEAIDGMNDTVLALVHASIQRSDSTVTREDLEKTLNFQDVFDLLVKIGEISTMAEIPLNSLTNRIQ